MRTYEQNIINPVALWELLDNNPYDLSSVVIHLAWREGLFRKEIHELRWEQVDFEAECLRLPDRTIPLEDKTAVQLKVWRNALEPRQKCKYVVSSLRSGNQVAEQSLSRLARVALNRIGMQDVRLVDLRHDFVRRMMEEYDYLYALQITGESLTTYHIKYMGMRNHQLPTMVLCQDLAQNKMRKDF